MSRNLVNKGGSIMYCMSCECGRKVMGKNEKTLKNIFKIHFKKCKTVTKEQILNILNKIDYNPANITKCLA